jgi:hypothetical protein
MTFEPGLNTTEYGEAPALREHGGWLTGTYVDAVNESRFDVVTCLNDVTQWYGDAGQNFKLDMNKWIGELGKLAEAAKAVDKAEDDLATELDAVAKSLADAESLARADGLTVRSEPNDAGKVESYILPPDPAPSPRSVIDKYRHKPKDWVYAHKTQLEDEYNAAVRADEDYQRKINTWHVCEAKVAGARKAERDAHADFRKALGEAIAPVVEAYSLAKFGGDVAISSVAGPQDAQGMLTKKADALRLLAQEMFGTAETAEKVYIGKHLSEADKARVAAWIEYRRTTRAAILGNADQYATRAQSIDKWLDQIPPDVRRAVEKNAHHLLGDLAYAELPGRHRGVGRYTKLARLVVNSKGATKVLRGVPLVGTTFTIAAGVGEVVLLGEDPAKVTTKAVAGTIASYLGGAAAGAVAIAASAPGMVVAGVVVVGGLVAGVGTDTLIDELWQDDLDGYELNVYRDDEADRDYTSRN